jgi:predicted SAM-dependent methyltransferase
MVGRKLHLASGSDYKHGWFNVDGNTSVKADFYCDLNEWQSEVWGRKWDYIYSQHFIEHLKKTDATVLLMRAHDALEQGGTIRIAVPDLAHLIEAYRTGQWRQDEWLNQSGIPEGCNLQTGAEYLNVSFYNWGHQFLHDQESLTLLLVDAGFDQKKIFRQEYKMSNRDELWNLETRPDSRLILEATK